MPPRLLALILAAVIVAAAVTIWLVTALGPAWGVGLMIVALLGTLALRKRR